MTRFALLLTLLAAPAWAQNTVSTPSTAWPTGTATTETVTAGITAATTQSQGQGALTSQINEIDTVGFIDDVVTLPTAAAGVKVTVINNGALRLQVFPASGDDVGHGVNISRMIDAAEMLAATAIDDTTWGITAAEAHHAEMTDAANTDVYVVTAQNDEQVYHTNGMAGGELNGWTFDAGGAGTSFPVASIADGTPTGVQAEITTTGSHLLAAGDLVSLSNMSAGTNAGIHLVVAPVTATTFEIVSANSTTATGTMDQSAVLTASVGAAGDYLVQWWASATSATNNETFDYNLHLNATDITGTASRRKFGTAADFGSFSGGALVTIADGDKIGFGLTNNDTAGNLTIRNFTLVLTEL